MFTAPFDTDEAADNWVTGGTAKRKHGGSLRVDNLRLQFGRQDLIRYKNREEMLAFNVDGLNGGPDFIGAILFFSSTCQKIFISQVFGKPLIGPKNSLSLV